MSVFVGAEHALFTQRGIRSYSSTWTMTPLVINHWWTLAIDRYSFVCNYPTMAAQTHSTVGSLPHQRPRLFQHPGGSQRNAGLTNYLFHRHTCWYSNDVSKIELSTRCWIDISCCAGNCQSTDYPVTKFKLHLPILYESISLFTMNCRFQLLINILNSHRSSVNAFSQCLQKKILYH